MRRRSRTSGGVFRGGRGWIPLAIVAIASLVAWLTVISPSLRARSIRARLPELPELRYQNELSKERFRRYGRRAREHPLSVEAVGGLGMLYHAYRFAPEARRCYRLARELAPAEFRWAYFWAVLEASVYEYEAAERLFELALERSPQNADARARLGDLRLKWNRAREAKADFERALELEPLHPIATLGLARLAMLSHEWRNVVKRLEPLLDRYPRLSDAHKYLARALDELGRSEEAAREKILGEYGAAVADPLLEEVYELAVPAIVEGGDPERGPRLLEVKCAKCHTHGRIYDTIQSRRWWASTVRRMQRLAGWNWLSDEEAASVVAFLASRDQQRMQETPPQAIPQDRGDEPGRD